MNELTDMAKRLGKKEMLLKVLQLAETDGKYWKLTNKQIEELQEWAK